MSIKEEIEQMAVAKIKCPSCEAEPSFKCRARNADDKGRHKPVPTHQRRLSTFMASSHVKWVSPERINDEP